MENKTNPVPITILLNSVSIIKSVIHFCRERFESSPLSFTTALFSIFKRTDYE